MLQLHSVTFAYDDAPSVLFRDVSVAFPAGWTGIVGANGSGKSTLLHLAAGLLTPGSGTVGRPGRVVLCEQRTDLPPPDLEAFLAAADGEACRLRGVLGVDADRRTRWPTLSHGERKRAQIGTALWLAPAALLLDEPTNHIDGDARRLLADALATFRGVGLLVSHDRELLDSLCTRCAFVDAPSVVVRPGTYTQALALAEADRARTVTERERARGAVEALRQESHLRHNEAARSHSRRSKRHLARGDRDGRAKIDAARVSGADGTAGRLASQLDGRLRQAEARLADAAVSKRYDTRIWVPGARSSRDVLFRIPAGATPLGPRRTLTHGELVMLPADRVAVTGPNGGGKSTLVRRLVGSLNVQAERVTFIPQEIAAEDARRIVADARALGSAELGRLMTVVSCLGSRPDRLLATADPSPGELRKLLLALGITREPHLVIMDEPTNHLDLPAIEALENALDGCPCGLLLVSHDTRFLQRLATVVWRVEADPGGPTNTRLRIE